MYENDNENYEAGSQDNLTYVRTNEESTTSYNADYAEGTSNNYEGNQAEGISVDGQTGKKEKKNKKNKKPCNSTLKSAVNGIVFGLCASLVVCGVYVVGRNTFLKPAMQTQEDQNDETSGNDPAKDDVKKTQIEKTETASSDNTAKASTASSNKGQLTVSEIAKNVMPSVVSITTKGVEEVRSMFGNQSYEYQGAGSGIIIGKNDSELLIATNNHVISNASEVSVCFDDEDKDAVISAKVKGNDASTDLAIVSVKLTDIPDKIMSSIKIATIGDSDKLEVGEQVVAIGNALGYGQSTTTGIISALDRTVEIENYSAKLIQTDAAINPGNSGGALLNMKGELIGINSAKLSDEKVEGMGYAIPISKAEPILDTLMNRETRDIVSDEEAGFLGVSIQDVSQEAQSYYDIPQGAYVASVEKDGAADKAGIQKGDIITKFDGLSVSNSSDLKGNIAYYKSGETVDVVIMRSNDGKYSEKTVQVTLAKSEAIEKQRAEQKTQNLDPKQGLLNPNQKDDNSDENSLEDNSEDQNYGQSDIEQFFGSDGLSDFFNQFYDNGRQQNGSTPNASGSNHKGI